MSAFKLFKLLPRFGKLFQFYLEEDRATPRNLRAWNSNLGTTVRLIIFDGINTVNRARARIILVESSMLLKPHCVSSIPVRFHGCRELAPQIRSSLNGIATPVLEKRRQELSLLSRIFLTLAWLRYRPTTHFAKSRFKCGMGQVHFQSSRDVWHCNARFLTFFGCHAPLFPPENLLACSLFLFGPTIELSLGSILFRTLYHPPRVEYILYISGLEITDSGIRIYNMYVFAFEKWNLFRCESFLSIHSAQTWIPLRIFVFLRPRVLSRSSSLLVHSIQRGAKNT